MIKHFGHCPLDFSLSEAGTAGVMHSSARIVADNQAYQGDACEYENEETSRFKTIDKIFLESTFQNVLPPISTSMPCTAEREGPTALHQRGVKAA